MFVLGCYYYRRLEGKKDRIAATIRVAGLDTVLTGLKMLRYQDGKVEETFRARVSYE